jgi:hypothetical protein
MSAQDRAERAVQVAQAIRRLGDTPAEVGGDHAAAQSQLASLGYSLAGIVLGLDEPVEVPT